jgi:antitoxin MazE
MRIGLVRIGNSRGVRIPKPLIEQCGLGDTVELRVEDDCLVIAPVRRPREGWEASFQTAGDGELLLNLQPSDFDREEWDW